MPIGVNTISWHIGIYKQALEGQCSIAETGDCKLCVLIAFSTVSASLLRLQLTNTRTSRLAACIFRSQSIDERPTMLESSCTSHSETHDSTPGTSTSSGAMANGGPPVTTVSQHISGRGTGGRPQDRPRAGGSCYRPCGLHPSFPWPGHPGTCIPSPAGNQRSTR